MAWHNVSRAHPCPICKKPDWCSVSDDGMICVCRRIMSDKQTKTANGWIHILKERPKTPFIPFQRAKRPTIPSFNPQRVMAGFRAEFEAEGNPDGDIFGSLLHIAEDLQIPACHIDRLLPGRSAYNNAWAFPMLNGDGKVCGIRLRQIGSSRKWSVSGSHDGLFYDPDMSLDDTFENGVRGREIVIVEGASDVAAGYSINLPAVGRSSCLSGMDQTRRLCARLRVTRVTVIGDNDQRKSRPDSSTFCPGVEGAHSIAKKLGLACRLILPPCKDLREWVRQGLTRESFARFAQLKKWVMP